MFLRMLTVLCYDSTSSLLAHASYTWVMILQLKNNTAILHFHVGRGGGGGQAWRLCAGMSPVIHREGEMKCAFYHVSWTLFTPSPPFTHIHVEPRRQKNIGKCCNYVPGICALHGSGRRAVPGLIFQLYHILVLFEDSGSAVPPVSHNWNEGRKM